MDNQIIQISLKEARCMILFDIKGKLVTNIRLISILTEHWMHV